MRITSEAGRRYFEDWVLALDKLLGWDRKRAIAWATHYEPQLNDEMSLLWRENSVFYIAFLLIPDSVKNKLSDLDRMYLAHRLENAILNLPQCAGMPLSECDWDTAIGPHRRRFGQARREPGQRTKPVRLVP
jgi:hypothetical protein